MSEVYVFLCYSASEMFITFLIYEYFIFLSKYLAITRWIYQLFRISQDVIPREVDYHRMNPLLLIKIVRFLWFSKS